MDIYKLLRHGEMKSKLLSHIRGKAVVFAVSPSETSSSRCRRHEAKSLSDFIRLHYWYFFDAALVCLCLKCPPLKAAGETVCRSKITEGAVQPCSNHL